MAELRKFVAEEERSGLDAYDSIRQSLVTLGVATSELTPFVRVTLLALRGWAGMIRQLEKRPDRVPVHPVPATLADFLVSSHPSRYVIRTPELVTVSRSTT